MSDLMVEQPTQKQIEALCHDYAQRWRGQDWPLMDEDEKCELRIEAHHWLKCWFALLSQERDQASS